MYACISGFSSTGSNIQEFIKFPVYKTSLYTKAFSSEVYLCVDITKKIKTFNITIATYKFLLILN